MAVTAEHFRAAFAAHYDDLVRFVRRRTDDDHVEDVVEEAFLALWRQRSLPPEVRPWLFATARNLMLNADRGKRRRDGLSVRIAGHLDAHVADPTDEVGLRMDVVAAWRRLPAGDQEVLALAVWEDLPPADAALVLGCSRAAYLMRLTRAKARLTPLLRDSDLAPAL